MPFEMVPTGAEETEKMKKMSSGGGGYITLEDNMKLVVVLKELTTHAAANKKGENVEYVDLIVADPSLPIDNEENEATLSFGITSTAGKQVIHEWALKSETGAYILKPEMVNATVSMVKVPVSPKAGGRAYKELRADIVSQPNKA
jgi:hypothetical protein